MLGTVVVRGRSVHGVFQIIHLLEINRGIDFHVVMTGVECERIERQTGLAAIDGAAGEGRAVDGPALDKVHAQAVFIGSKANAQLLHVVAAFCAAAFVHGDFRIGVAGHAFQLGNAGQIQQLRNMVYAHIKQCAAAGGGGVHEFLGGVAVHKGTVAAAEAGGTHVVDMTQIAVINETLGGLGLLAVQRAQLDVQLFAGFDHGVVHGLRIRKGTGHGLFAVGMLAQTQGFDGHGCMQIVVQAYIHRVDIIHAQKLADAGGAALHAVFVAHFIHAGFVDITQGNDFGLGDLRVIAQMLFADDTVADHADPNLFHVLLSPAYSCDM